MKVRQKKQKTMKITKENLEDLITKAKGILKNMGEEDTSYDLLHKYVQKAEVILPDVEGDLSSSQKEVYDDLEVALGI